jgi:hypothetical protein
LWHIRQSLAVVDQYLDRCALAIAEDEQGTGEGVGLKALAARGHQRIDAAAEVDRLDGHQDAHVRRDLDHHALQKAWHSAGKPASAPPRSCSRIVAPRALAISTTHCASAPPAGSGSPCGATHSTKRGPGRPAEAPIRAARRLSTT